MDIFKYNDTVYYQGEEYLVKFVDDLTVLIAAADGSHRLRVNHLTLSRSM